MLRTANINSVPTPFSRVSRKHVLPRALVHHVEADHEHFPDRIVQRALERFVGEIDDRVLGQPDMPDLALLLLRDRAPDASVSSA